MYIYLREFNNFYYLVNNETLRIEKFSDINSIKSSIKRVRDCDRLFLPSKFESQNVCFFFNQSRSVLYLWYDNYSYKIEFHKTFGVIIINEVVFDAMRDVYIMFMYTHHNRLVLHTQDVDITIYNGRVLDSDEVIKGKQCSQSAFKREVILNALCRPCIE